MTTSLLGWRTPPYLSLLAVACMSFGIAARAQVTVQNPGNVVGTGDEAWSYLVLEGEHYDSKLGETPEAGFTRVDASGSVTSFLGNPVLGSDTTASGGGALWTQTVFGPHSDKVTYQVQFSQPGTYYLYMRFTMFENGGNEAHYLNEDSFFVAPGFNMDPQTDWPLSDLGGYTEGCCDYGFLTFKENGVAVSHSAGEEEGQAFWEGNFHWNELYSSQFLNPETGGEPAVRHKFEVTQEQVGVPMDWTISYREGGLAVDLFLFSTHSNLIEAYTPAQLDDLLVAAPIVPEVTVQDPGDVVGTGDQAWSYLILEGEDYDLKAGETPEAGFAKVDDSGTVKSFLENPVLGSDTTASGKGALWTQTIFGPHSDKVTYKVQFTQPGTYYLYMRFTMFENGGNVAHYLNEDSFFVAPGFNMDPQTDWPLSDLGGYTEGCCDYGFLTFKENGVAVSHSAGEEEGQAFWEGKFHWNELYSSQFLNPETGGEPAVRHKYEVTTEQLGKPLDWTISYREGGLTVDLFLFSTHTNLIEAYTQAELDQLLLQPAAAGPQLAITLSGNTATVSWPVSAEGFVLETTGPLQPASWSAVTASPVVDGTRNTVSVQVTDQQRYYRLRKP